jgi:hypothetical protein
VVVEVVGPDVVVVDVVEVVVEVVVVVVVPVQRRRPVASGGSQFLEQQSACSRQTRPPSRQMNSAPVSCSPTRPKAPAMSPPIRRRREPLRANDRVKESKRDPSTPSPFLMLPLVSHERYGGAPSVLLGLDLF